MIVKWIFLVLLTDSDYETVCCIKQIGVSLLNSCDYDLDFTNLTLSVRFYEFADAFACDYVKAKCRFVM